MSFMTDDLSGEAKSTASKRRTSRARPVKRALDIMLVLFALPFLLPFMALLVVALLFVDGRPFIFRHKRIGQDGKTFDCLKLRTMRRDADKALAELLERDPERMKEWKETQKLKGDPRVHLLGRVLRATSVDELPQLLNVLRGEMSIVGPRPIVAEELERYGGRAGIYLSMKPGITGLWQISRRDDTSYEERILMDVEYYRTCSLWTDLVIIWKTVGVVVFAKNEM